MAYQETAINPSGRLDPGAGRARRALLAAVVVALWGLITHGTFAGSGDEPHYLAIAHSIAFDGDLDLANNYGPNEPLISAGTLEPESHVRPGVNGIIRPVHDIGLPLLFAPYVRLAVPVTRWLSGTLSPSAMHRARLTPAVLYRHLISLAMIVLAAALAGQLYDTFRWLGGSTRSAALTALLVALSPPLLVFGVLFFTELLSALLCLVVCGWCWRADRGTRAAWGLIGLVTGSLLLVHVKNVGLVVPLAALALYTLRAGADRRRAAAFALGLTTMIAVRTAVNYRLWGTWVTSPHAAHGAWPGWRAAAGEMLTRVVGMLVDQEFGLLVYAPIYLMALVGIVVLAKSRREVATWIALIVLCMTTMIALPITNVHGWTGGWSPAARFLTPVVPLAGIAVFAALREAPRAVVVAIVAVQITLNAYFWQHPKMLWNDGDGRAALCMRLGEAVCSKLPSLVRVQPERAWPSSR